MLGSPNVPSCRGSEEDPHGGHSAYLSLEGILLGAVGWILFMDNVFVITIIYYLGRIFGSKSSTSNDFLLNSEAHTIILTCQVMQKIKVFPARGCRS